MAELEKGATVRLRVTAPVRPILRGLYGQVMRVEARKDRYHLEVYPWGSSLGPRSVSLKVWVSAAHLDVLEPDEAARLAYLCTADEKDNPIWAGAFKGTQEAWTAWSEFLACFDTRSHHRDPWLPASLDDALKGLDLGEETRRSAGGAWHNLLNALGIMNIVATEQVGV